MQTQYTYESALAAAYRINWQVDDIIGGDKRLNFARPFMPEALARVEALDFLDRDEKLVLNQIRGHGYLYTFGLVEEFILPFVLDHARGQISRDHMCTRAFLQFASEEAKHIHLFKRFREDFEAGFGTKCDVIGPPEAIARAVLSKQPLAVALLTLHIEWMVQRHYVDSVKDDRALDPQFKNLLKYHWMEEVQHAKLDTLMIEAMAANCSAEEKEKAIDGYLELGAMFDTGMEQQAKFDMDALTRATGRVFDDAAKRAYMANQHQALRWTYIGSGMTHPNFLATIGALSPAGRKRIEEIAPTFC